MLKGFHRADNAGYKPLEAKRAGDEEYKQCISVVEVDGEELEIARLNAGEAREVNGKKEIIIFHPGFALDVRTAQGLITALSGEMGEIVGVSPFGGGRSSTPEEITPARESYLYQGLVEKLDFKPETHQLINVGYSNGCFAALITAIQRPELFRGVVIANSVLNNWDKLPKLALDYAMNVSGHFVKQPRMTAGLLAGFLKSQPSFKGLLYQGVKAGSFRKEVYHAMQMFPGDLLVIESQEDVRGKTRKPGIGTKGDFCYLDAAGKAEALCALAPGARSIDSHCAPGPHTWLLQHPEKFAKIISDWREKLSDDYPLLD